MIIRRNRKITEGRISKEDSRSFARYIKKVASEYIGEEYVLEMILELLDYETMKTIADELKRMMNDANGPLDE